jgi:hypothetical protein
MNNHKLTVAVIDKMIRLIKNEKDKRVLLDTLQNEKLCLLEQISSIREFFFSVELLWFSAVFLMLSIGHGNVFGVIISSCLITFLIIDKIRDMVRIAGLKRQLKVIDAYIDKASKI